MTGHRGAAVGAALLAAISLSGCWLQIGFDAGHTRFNHYEQELTPDVVADLRPDWTVDLLATAQEPVVGDGKVYVQTSRSSEEGTRLDVRAYRAADGAPAWTRTLFDRPAGAGALFDDVPVTFVGQQLWTGYMTTTPRPETAYPVRLDPADGEVLGQGGATGPYPTPFVDGGSLVASVRGVPVSEWLLEVSDVSTGQLRWRASFPWPPPARLGVPSIADGQLFLVAGTTLHAFPLDGCGAPTTCTPTWSVDVGESPWSSVVAVPGRDDLFVNGADGLVAVNRATGATEWQGAPGSGGELAVAAGTVYVVGGSTLRAFPADGCGGPVCEPSWTASLGSAAVSAPTVAAGVVYVGVEGAVEAFPAAGCGAPMCDRLARVDVTGTLVGVSVAEGRLFVASHADGVARLTAFGP